ncbi:heat shock 70kDa protein 4 [Clonorchis sinensis]|uniref:Heat shock 70kDa protein 4 n=1 Tax=Clonorchis sinensis TaxID=79923 RepID=G7YQG1_CLOSI|nr:heat shock 70kDa protein 4 [Clonorchis sinensis]
MICTLNKEQIMVCSTEYDRNLGAYAFDTVLLNHLKRKVRYLDKFRHHLHTQFDLKGRELEGLKACQNSTLDPCGDMLISIDQTKVTIERQTYQPLLDRFQELLKTCLAQSTLTVDNIHSVELFCETRYKLILHDIVSRVFVGKTVSTIPLEVAIAYGCALNAAGYALKSVRTEPRSPFRPSTRLSKVDLIKCKTINPVRRTSHGHLRHEKCTLEEQGYEVIRPSRQCHTQDMHSVNRFDKEIEAQAQHTGEVWSRLNKLKGEIFQANSTIASWAEFAYLKDVCYAAKRDSASMDAWLEENKSSRQIEQFDARITEFSGKMQKHRQKQSEIEKVWVFVKDNVVYTTRNAVNRPHRFVLQDVSKKIVNLKRNDAEDALFLAYLRAVYSEAFNYVQAMSEWLKNNKAQISVEDLHRQLALLNSKTEFFKQRQEEEEQRERSRLLNRLNEKLNIMRSQLEKLRSLPDLVNSIVDADTFMASVERSWPQFAAASLSNLTAENLKLDDWWRGFVNTVEKKLMDSITERLGRTKAEIAKWTQCTDTLIRRAKCTLGILEKCLESEAQKRSIASLTLALQNFSEQWNLILTEKELEDRKQMRKALAEKLMDAQKMVQNWSASGCSKDLISNAKNLLLEVERITSSVQERSSSELLKESQNFDERWKRILVQKNEEVQERIRALVLHRSFKDGPTEIPLKTRLGVEGERVNEKKTSKLSLSAAVSSLLNRRESKTALTSVKGVPNRPTSDPLSIQFNRHSGNEVSIRCAIARTLCSRLPKFVLRTGGPQKWFSSSCSVAQDVPIKIKPLQSVANATGNRLKRLIGL